MGGAPSMSVSASEFRIFVNAAGIVLHSLVAKRSFWIQVCLNSAAVVNCSLDCEAHLCHKSGCLLSSRKYEETHIHVFIRRGWNDTHMFSRPSFALADILAMPISLTNFKGLHFMLHYYYTRTCCRRSRIRGWDWVPPSTAIWTVIGNEPSSMSRRVSREFSLYESHRPARS